MWVTLFDGNNQLDTGKRGVFYLGGEKCISLDELGIGVGTKVTIKVGIEWGIPGNRKLEVTYHPSAGLRTFNCKGLSTNWELEES